MRQDEAKKEKTKQKKSVESLDVVFPAVGTT